MIHPVSSLTPVKSNNPLTYWPAAYLSVLSGQKKMAVLLQPLQTYADGSKGCSEQPFPTSPLFTALKVASYILTAFIFPALAFLVNYVIRHYNKFHYATVEFPAAVTNALPGFAAFNTKCLGAEKYVEDLIQGKLPGAKQQTPKQIEAALSSYTDALIQEWTAFQSEAFRLGIEVPQIGVNIQELTNRLIARKSQYVLSNINKAAKQSEAEYQKALSAEKQDYAKKMQGLQELRKKIEAAATKQSDADSQYLKELARINVEFLNQMGQNQSAYQQALAGINQDYKKNVEATKKIQLTASAPPPPPAIDRTFLTKTYPHVIYAHTFTCLNVFQLPGNKIQVVVVSALFGNALTMTLQHADIEWRTAPTAENVRNPANWKMDGIKVIFQA
jgi:hypothetical protein